MFNQEEEMEQGVKTTVLSLKDLKMEVIINNRFKEFSFDSNVRGFHVYKNIWNPRIDKDCLKCQYESGNNNDKFAIGVYLNDKMKEKIVGHVPLYLSKAMFQFIQLLQSKLPCTVKGKQVNRGAGFSKNLRNWSSAKLNISENQKICHPQNYTCTKICASFLCGNLEISSL